MVVSWFFLSLRVRKVETRDGCGGSDYEYLYVHTVGVRGVTAAVERASK